MHKAVTKSVMSESGSISPQTQAFFMAFLHNGGSPEPAGQPTAGANAGP